MLPVHTIVSAFVQLFGSSYSSTETGMGDKFSTYEELKEKLRMRQDEIFKLQAANSDLNQVNKRWHRYNSDLQVFIEKLQTTIRDQQEQINRIFSSDDCENLHERDKGGECSKKSCVTMREEVKKLKERVKHLELQVKSHKEDWEAERAEKKAVAEAKDELERRFSAALRDLYSAKRSREDVQESRSCLLCRSYNLPSSSSRNDVQTVIHCNHMPQANGCGSTDFLYGNVVCDSSDDRDTTTGMTTLATGVTASRSLGTLSVGIKSSSFTPVARSPSAPSTTFSETEDDISCPACDKVFSSRVHLEFLDHFEACQARHNGTD